MTLTLAPLRNFFRDPLYRHSSFLIASTAFSAGTGFAFWLIAARLAEAHDVGRAAGLIAAVSFLVYLTSLGLPYGALRYVGAVLRYSPLINVALFLSAASSVVASLIFVVGSRWWVPELVPLLDSYAEISLFVVFNVAVAMGLLLDSIFAARRAAEFAVVRSIVSGVGKLVGLVFFLSLGALGIYFSMFLPVLLSTALLLFLLPSILGRYRRTDAAITPEAKELVLFSLRNYPASLLAGATPFLLPLVVLGLRGSQDTAYFYVAWNITIVLLLVPTAISQMSLSEATRSDADAWEVARKAQRFALLIAAPLCLVVFLGTDVILAIYGSEYASHGAWPLRLLVLSTLPWVLVTLNLSALRAEKRYSDVFIIAALLCGLTLGLAVTLSVPLGLSGIGAGWTLGLLLTAVAVEIRAEMITGVLRGRGRSRCQPAMEEEAQA